MRHRPSPSSLLLASAGFLALAPLFQGGPATELPHTFQPGTPSRAGEVNQNFQALLAGLNDLPRPANRIVVASERGDFASVAEALDSITDASDGNPSWSTWPRASTARPRPAWCRPSSAWSARAPPRP